jgi:hypothetical protein
MGIVQLLLFVGVDLGGQGQRWTSFLLGVLGKFPPSWKYHCRQPSCSSFPFFAPFPPKFRFSASFFIVFLCKTNFAIFPSGHVASRKKSVDGQWKVERPWSVLGQGRKVLSATMGEVLVVVLSRQAGTAPGFRDSFALLQRPPARPAVNQLASAAAAAWVGKLGRGSEISRMPWAA